MFEGLPGSPCGCSRVRAGEADPAGSCGHSKDFTLRERNGHWGFSAEGWHSVTYTVKEHSGGSLVGCGG